ncbi:translocation/assembly module TamB domain-containing protein [Isoalcanivorax indicus]|uniref:translocation/assembly module TamB domain-containing protein n=1 Tax=Isoalcanivorax indicus TaxID=2202653 RepID=UPI000DB943C1|nr:translocation/assembly module TamB domain-containing protein [Isoalcanivorax indicus]
MTAGGRVIRILRALVRWALVGTLLLLILLPAALLGLMAHEGGSRWLLLKAAELAPGEVSVAEIQGTLLHGITLTDVHYAHPAVTVESDRFSLAVVMPALLQRRVAINTLQADRLRVTLHASERDEDDLPDDEAPFHIDQLDDIRLPVAIAVYGAHVTDFTLTLANGTDIHLDEILLAANTDGNRLHVQQLFVREDTARISLSGNMGLAQPFALDTWLDWQAPLPEALHGALAGPEADPAEPLMARADARVRGTLAEPTLVHRLHAPVTLRSEGSLRPFDTPLAFDLDNHWDAFTLYGADGQALALADGRLEIDGSLEDYRLQLASGTTLPDLPAIGVEVRAHGNLQAAHIERARLDVADSRIELAGDVTWAPDLTWDIQLGIEDFDPALLVAELPGRLALDTRVQGSLKSEHLTLDLALNRLSGEVRGQRLDGGGSLQLTRAPDQAISEARLRSDLQLRAGNNRVSLRGSANQRLDLHLALIGDDLAALWPDLHGTLHLDARVHGTRSAPVLQARINSEEIGYAEWRLHDLSLVADATNGPDAPLMSLALGTGHLTRSGDVVLERVAVNGDGDASDHRMTWAITAPQGSTRGAAAGMLEDLRAWQGMLRALEIDSPISGLWQLDRPVALGASAEAAHLAPMCLVAEESRLCLDGHWRAEGPTEARLDLTNLALAYLARELPEDAAELEGVINLSARFNQRDGRNTAEADLQVSAGRMALSSGRDEPYELAWRGLSAHLNLDGTQLTSHAHFDVDDTSGTHARLNAELDGDNTRLDGELNTYLDDLGWVEVFVPDLRNIRGRVRGDLTLRGTVAAPRFGGQLILDEAAADVPEVGLSLTDIRLLAEAERGGDLTLTGQVTSGDGTLNLDGVLDTSEPLPWPVRLQVRGENFLAVQRPDARVLINPDLDIRVARNLITIRGDITIPQARFEPRDLPQQAVSVSRDEIIVSDEPDESSPWQVDTEVTVRLGNRVSMQGFGLQARFVGDVRIEDKPERTPRLIGEIRIEDGRYRAYGQDLHVERGTLIFQGPPDNPGLDIVAVRIVTAYNVRAGLRIGGTLQDPRSRVFSEPSMEETEAMSFLLTGRPLDSGSDADAVMIMQAIALYGIERGEFITERLGQTLGLELGVDTEGEFEDTALMLGKQISSRLYLRYSVGLFEALNTVMLRYTLSRSLSLETRTNSKENAIDLIFRTER